MLTRVEMQQKDDGNMWCEYMGGGDIAGFEVEATKIREDGGKQNRTFTGTVVVLSPRAEIIFRMGDHRN